ncbi:MAG: YaaA family protein [Candidatus Saccharibacteria bacterium]
MTAPIQILINSSKTMTVRSRENIPARSPSLQAKAQQLAAHLKTLTPDELRHRMHISPKLADATHDLITAWGEPGKPFGTALDTFSGDIYRGLKAETLTHADRLYADQTLRILSGLYGLVRPLDAIQPYRLEMLYHIHPRGFKNLYDFWGDAIAKALDQDALIVNLASEEYFKAVAPYIDPDLVVSPQFLTRTAATEPTFVAIHAKWARGSFARWLVVTQYTNPADFATFNDMGYTYTKALSTRNRPTFIRSM